MLHQVSAGVTPNTRPVYAVGHLPKSRGEPGTAYLDSHVRHVVSPSPVPDTPLIEAKLELVQERGGDAFTEYSLPEAILKLRQGVGRLIRTKTDQGIVVILDNRIVTKPYGRAFMQALPKCPVEIV